MTAQFDLSKSVGSGKIKTADVVTWLNRHVGMSGVDWKMDTKPKYRDHWRPSFLLVSLRIVDDEKASFFALTWM